MTRTTVTLGPASAEEGLNLNYFMPRKCCKQKKQYCVGHLHVDLLQPATNFHAKVVNAVCLKTAPARQSQAGVICHGFPKLQIRSEFEQTSVVD